MVLKRKVGVGGILFFRELCIFYGIIVYFAYVLVGGLVIFRESKIIFLFLWKGVKGRYREFYYYKVR